jgi:uncharacterized protein YkwD
MIDWAAPDNSMSQLLQKPLSKHLPVTQFQFSFRLSFWNNLKNLEHSFQKRRSVAATRKFSFEFCVPCGITGIVRFFFKIGVLERDLARRYRSFWPSELTNRSFTLKVLNAPKAHYYVVMASAPSKYDGIRGRRGSVIPNSHVRSLSLQSIPEAQVVEIDEYDFYTLPHTYSPRSSSSSMLYPMFKPVVLESSEFLKLVNSERAQLGLQLFQGSQSLDQLAERQAKEMAKLKRVFHSVSSIEELTLLLGSEVVAENIQRGEDFTAMFDETVYGTSINRDNLFSTHFTEFGSAAVLGCDGMIYSCQLFRGS